MKVTLNLQKKANQKKAKNQFDCLSFFTFYVWLWGILLARLSSFFGVLKKNTAIL